MESEAKSPGSFNTFVAIEGLDRDDINARRDYEKALVRFRLNLAVQLGVTVDELHEGIATAAGSPISNKKPPQEEI